jgi:succinate dehydrogenase / fumarate reductase cytochrome b subunit
VKDNRPVNLDFTTFKLPLPALTSIIHRIAGGFLFFGIALLLFLLDRSLQSESSFNQVAALFDSVWVKLITWAVVAALLYHLIAGIKHLIMDMGIGEHFEGAMLASKIIIALSAIAIVLAGIWLW